MMAEAIEIFAIGTNRLADRYRSNEVPQLLVTVDGFQTFELPPEADGP